MATTYDTALIREAARQVQVMSGQLDESVVHQLELARDAVEDWKGLTADALEEQLAARRKALLSDLQHLADIAAKLRAYANALDDADRQLAGMMRGRR